MVPFESSPSSHSRNQWAFFGGGEGAPAASATLCAEWWNGLDIRFGDRRPGDRPEDAFDAFDALDDSGELAVAVVLAVALLFTAV